MDSKYQEALSLYNQCDYEGAYAIIIDNGLCSTEKGDFLCNECRKQILQQYVYLIKDYIRQEMYGEATGLRQYYYIQYGFSSELSSITIPEPINPVENEIDITENESVPISTDSNLSSDISPQVEDESNIACYEETNVSKKKNNGLLTGGIVSVVLIICSIIGYNIWYVPYAIDRDAPRTYVVANNVFLRSSKMAGVEYNIIEKVPYGQEIITYNKGAEWSNVKVKEKKGFIASIYLLYKPDFDLLHGIWGNIDDIGVVISSKCRMAMLDFYKRFNLQSGVNGWQLFTNGKTNKINTIAYPRLFDKQSKYTDYVFIIKKQDEDYRYMAIYSFDDETERPIFRISATIPLYGNIQSIKNMNNMIVVHLDTGQEFVLHVPINNG